MDRYGAETTPCARGFHVLLVDDDVLNLGKMKHRLNSNSYIVTAEVSAKAALSMILEKAFQYDIVIAEKAMPEIDGFKFLEQIRARCHNIPVIILMTANVEPGMAEKALSLGATRFFKKPIAEHDLDGIWQHVVFKRSIDESECIPRKVLWTQELKSKFNAAVNELGGINAKPLEILKLMNVPNLKRRQVSNYLQKHRIKAKNTDTPMPDLMPEHNVPNLPMPDSVPQLNEPNLSNHTGEGNTDGNGINSSQFLESQWQEVFLNSMGNESTSPMMPKYDFVGLGFQSSSASANLINSSMEPMQVLSNDQHLKLLDLPSTSNMGGLNTPPSVGNAFSCGQGQILGISSFMSSNAGGLNDEQSQKLLDSQLEAQDDNFSQFLGAQWQKVFLNSMGNESTLPMMPNYDFIEVCCPSSSASANFTNSIMEPMQVLSNDQHLKLMDFPSSSNMGNLNIPNVGNTFSHGQGQMLAISPCLSSNNGDLNNEQSQRLLYSQLEAQDDNFSQFLGAQWQNVFLNSMGNESTFPMMPKYDFVGAGCPNSSASANFSDSIMEPMQVLSNDPQLKLLDLPSSSDMGGLNTPCFGNTFSHGQGNMLTISPCLSSNTGGLNNEQSQKLFDSQLEVQEDNFSQFLGAQWQKVFLNGMGNESTFPMMPKYDFVGVGCPSSSASANLINSSIEPVQVLSNDQHLKLFNLPSSSNMGGMNTPCVGNIFTYGQDQMLAISPCLSNNNGGLNNEQSPKLFDSQKAQDYSALAQEAGFMDESGSFVPAFLDDLKAFLDDDTKFEE